MVTITASGSQVAVIGTEHTLSNPTTNKYFTSYIDLTNMTVTDTVEIRVYVIAKTSGSYIQYYMSSYSGIQASPLVYIPSLPSDLGYKLTLKQTAGTGRTYDFKVYEI